MLGTLEISSFEPGDSLELDETSGNWNSTDFVKITAAIRVVCPYPSPVPSSSAVNVGVHIEDEADVDRLNVAMEAVEDVQELVRANLM